MYEKISGSITCTRNRSDVFIQYCKLLSDSNFFWKMPLSLKSLHRPLKLHTSLFSLWTQNKSKICHFFRFCNDSRWKNRTFFIFLKSLITSCYKWLITLTNIHHLDTSLRHSLTSCTFRSVETALFSTPKSVAELITRTIILKTTMFEFLLVPDFVQKIVKIFLIIFHALQSH